MHLPKKIIDTHFHIWDTRVLELPWLNMFEGKLKTKYSLNDYERAITGLNIVQSCYEEVDTIKEQHQQEAEMAIDLCMDQSNQVTGITIAANLASSSFKTYIEPFVQEQVVKSVRHNFFASDPKASQATIFIENVQHLSESGIMCDLVMPASHILYGVALVKACPDTTFVINHCGVCPILADKKAKAIWHHGIEQYANHNNTICKISECGFTYPNYNWQVSDVVDIIKHCVTSFGEDHIVYGTNWPVCEMTAPISQWIEAINVSIRDYPKQFSDKLFFENAKRFYKL